MSVILCYAVLILLEPVLTRYVRGSRSPVQSMLMSRDRWTCLEAIIKARTMNINHNLCPSRAWALERTSCPLICTCRGKKLALKILRSCVNDCFWYYKQLAACLDISLGIDSIPQMDEYSWLPGLWLQLLVGHRNLIAALFFPAWLAPEWDRSTITSLLYHWINRQKFQTACRSFCHIIHSLLYVLMIHLFYQQSYLPSFLLVLMYCTCSWLSSFKSFVFALLLDASGMPWRSKDLFNIMTILSMVWFLVYVCHRWK